MGLDPLSPLEETIPDETGNQTTTSDVVKGDEEGKEPTESKSGEGNEEAPNEEAEAKKAAQTPTPKTSGEGDAESTNNTTPPPKEEPNPEKIPIEYTFSWTDEGNNEGIIGVANNVGLPFIKYGVANVEGQGGKDEIMNEKSKVFGMFGEYMDGVSFPKTGTPTVKSNAKFRVVSKGV